MRKLVLLEHVSLDGYMAGPKGEMDWIRFDDELGDHAGSLVDEADTAIYGRVTYEMMAGYWPTAAEQPNASPHDRKHAAWVSNATKIVVSRTLQTAPWGAADSATIVRDNVEEEIARLKQQPGKNLLLIGSIRLARSLIEADLVDEYRITVNPVILGSGQGLFENLTRRLDLKLAGTRTFGCGVVGLHYERAR